LIEEIRLKIFEKLGKAYRKLAEYLTRKEKPKAWEKINLHPEVRDAFVAALQPVARRETPSVMGSTSRGRSWFPRRCWYPAQVRALPPALQLPKKSPFVLEVTLRDGTAYLQRHGTMERVDKLFAGV